MDQITNDCVLVMVRIMIQIRKFLQGFFYLLLQFL